MTAVKMSGKDFKDFYNDPTLWAGEAYHDDVLILVNGAEFVSDALDGDASTIADTDQVVVEYGVYYAPDGADKDLAAVARRWLKARSTTTLLVEVAKDKQVALVAAVKAAGGRVV
jgi:monoamine oxidase